MCKYAVPHIDSISICKNLCNVFLSKMNMQALMKRAKANSTAQLGQYDPSTESSEAGERTYEKGYVY